METCLENEKMLVFLLLIIIFLLVKLILEMKRSQEILEKLDLLSEKVLADEVGESEIVKKKNEQIEALRAELAETKEKGGMTAEEEEEFMNAIEAKIADIEAGINLSEEETTKELEVPTEDEAKEVLEVPSKNEGDSEENIQLPVDDTHGGDVQGGEDEEQDVVEPSNN